jgi:hypothetical protein
MSRRRHYIFIRARCRARPRAIKCIAYESELHHAHRCDQEAAMNAKAKRCRQPRIDQDEQARQREVPEAERHVMGHAASASKTWPASTSNPRLATRTAWAAIQAFFCTTLDCRSERRWRVTSVHLQTLSVTKVQSRGCRPRSPVFTTRIQSVEPKAAKAFNVLISMPHSRIAVSRIFTATANDALKNSRSSRRRIPMTAGTTCSFL